MSDAKKYRSAQDGELGTLVERDGNQYVKLNRPHEEILRHFNGGNGWIPEVENRPISRAQLGFVCFEADKALRQVLGDYSGAKKTWQDLSDKQRILWMDEGPKSAERSAVWKAIQMILEPLTR